jgi:Ribbon-helix-helix protein, copG family
VCNTVAEVCDTVGLVAKSFRLDPELQRRLEQAAARQGVPASELIRDAVRRRCDEVLGDSLRAELGPLVGALEIGGIRSADTGAAFTELLRQRHERRRRA